MRIVNFEILKNPINWAIVLLMLILFGIAADMVVRHFKVAKGAN